jgi:hypothetical protein
MMAMTKEVRRRQIMIRPARPKTRERAWREGERDTCRASGEKGQFNQSTTYRGGEENNPENQQGTGEVRNEEEWEGRREDQRTYLLNQDLFGPAAFSARYSSSASSISRKPEKRSASCDLMNLVLVKARNERREEKSARKVGGEGGTGESD